MQKNSSFEYFFEGSGGLQNNKVADPQNISLALSRGSRQMFIKKRDGPRPKLRPSLVLLTVAKQQSKGSIKGHVKGTPNLEESSLL